jgi:hypothetical protein
MIDEERLNREGKRLGINLGIKPPDDIRRLHDELEKSTLVQVDLFVKSIKEKVGAELLTKEKFKTVTEVMWQEVQEAKKTLNREWITRKVFDKFVCVAEHKLFPGAREGHFRTPSLKDHLAGRGGDPFTDLMMTLFNEAEERKRKK